MVTVLQPRAFWGGSRRRPFFDGPEFIKPISFKFSSPWTLHSPGNLFSPQMWPLISLDISFSNSFILFQGPSGNPWPWTSLVFRQHTRYKWKACLSFKRKYIDTTLRFHQHHNMLIVTKAAALSSNVLMPTLCRASDFMMTFNPTYAHYSSLAPNFVIRLLEIVQRRWTKQTERMSVILCIMSS